MTSYLKLKCKRTQISVLTAFPQNTSFGIILRVINRVMNLEMLDANQYSFFAGWSKRIQRCPRGSLFHVGLISNPHHHHFAHSTIAQRKQQAHTLTIKVLRIEKITTQDKGNKGMKQRIRGRLNKRRREQGTMVYFSVGV